MRNSKPTRKKSGCNYYRTSRAGGGRGGWTDLIVRFSSSRREWEIFRARRLLFSGRKETAIAHNLRIRVAFSSSAGSISSLHRRPVVRVHLEKRLILDHFPVLNPVLSGACETGSTCSICVRPIPSTFQAAR